jgi:hypothetical protein
VTLQTNTPSPSLVGSEMKDFLSLLSDKFILYETAYSSGWLKPIKVAKALGKRRSKRHSRFWTRKVRNPFLSKFSTWFKEKIK